MNLQRCLRPEPGCASSPGDAGRGGPETRIPTITLLLLLVPPVPGIGAADVPPVATPRLAGTVEAYSIRLPDAYDVVWPTGALLPLYGPDDRSSGVLLPSGPLSGAIRRVPVSEFEEIIEPRSRGLIGLMTRALGGVAGSPPGLRSAHHLWVVEFSLRSGDTRRDWIPRSVGLASTSDLESLRGALAHFRVRRPPLFRGDPLRARTALADLRVVDPDPDRVGRVARLARDLGSLAARESPDLELGYPAVIRFVRPGGGLDPAALEQLLGEPRRVDEPPLYRNHRFTDARGWLVLEGADPAAAEDAVRQRLARRIRDRPASYQAREDPPHTVIGSERVVLRQLVLEGPGGLDVLRAGLSVGSAGSRFLTLPVRPPAAGEPEAPPVPADRSAWALRVASRMDPTRYMRWISELDGEREATPALAGSGGIRFTDRTLHTSRSQLGQVVTYLTNYYRSLGLSVRTEDCPFRGRVFQNVIVELPGDTDEWVLLADHIDTRVAIETDAAPEPRMRATPGADDNASATAVLMEAARVLAPRWIRGTPGGPPGAMAGLRLVHLTGEEFPGDCLGARIHATRTLARGERIRGLILMDMIGYAGAGGRLEDPVFQLNSGESRESAGLAALAVGAFASLQRAGLAPAIMRPVHRRRFDPRSYLYNTDGVIFSDLGYPTLLLNEHINRDHQLDRRGYHDDHDTVAHICRPYAVAIARLAVTTALMAASRD